MRRGASGRGNRQPYDAEADLNADMELAVEDESLGDLKRAIKKAGVPVPEAEEEIRNVVRSLREAVNSLRFRKA